MSRKVLIVDDHPLVCQAIRQALVTIGFEAVGETADGVEALRMIESLAPDVVILDIGLEKLDGLSVLRRITREKLDTRVLVFTAQAKENYATRCLQAGATGFVGKSEPIGKLIKAVETVADGYIFFPKDFMPLLGKHELTGDLEDLTDRELQILKMLAQGLSNGDIAKRLSLSNKTISGHKVNIQTKLGVVSVIELADIARRHNLI
ncbi:MULTISPECIES: response regulator transcription factor [Pseudomonas]|uniref:Response regulator transcription factor n=1 Tax=Pseudomonas sessilinigenes TaxID=658629 RepID=A0ABX8N0K3_9PSED|nr:MULTISPECIES: response regulator transcription factor [Pseudomonas]QIH08277.1 response regulator transcription factor [Pseudomonas sp. BIOMIG1BAC]QXH43531.1 response regulator transcription factor [Pseudomonas sessilinigenes]